MRLTYVFHSGFIWEGEDFVCIFDYYRDSEKENEGVVHDLLKKKDKPLYVLVSHHHPDHFNPEILQWKAEYPQIRYILSRDVRKRLRPEQREGIIFLSKMETWGDERIQVKAYGSTDVGGSFFVEAGGKKIFHAGDLNNWHWREESTEQEAKGYERNFLRELDVFAREEGCLDLTLFPVDPRLGKDYMAGAIQFVDRVKTEWFAPMHFWERYAEADVFGSYAEARGIRFIAWTHPGQEVVIG